MISRKLEEEFKNLSLFSKLATGWMLLIALLWLMIFLNLTVPVLWSIIMGITGQVSGFALGFVITLYPPLLIAVGGISYSYYRFARKLIVSHERGTYFTSLAFLVMMTVLTFVFQYNGGFEVLLPSWLGISQIAQILLFVSPLVMGGVPLILLILDWSKWYKN